MKREKWLRKFYLNNKFLLVAGLMAMSFCFTSCGQEEESPKQEINSDLDPRLAPDSNAEAPIVVKTVPDNDPNLKDEMYTEKYASGVIKIKGAVLGGKRDGEWMSWYENGKPWSACSYRQGILDGPIQTWYENGQMRYRGSYKEGKRSGKWTFWTEKGVLDSEKNF